MKTNNQGRYSGLIRPIQVTLDLFAVFGLALFVFTFYKNAYYYLLPLFGVSWFLSTFFSKYYKVYRFTKLIHVLGLVFKQISLFAIIVFALSGYFYELEIKPKTNFNYIAFVFASITIIKVTVFLLLKKYRRYFNGNFRNVVIFGKSKQSKALEQFFNNNLEYGYKHLKTFNFEDSENLQTYFDYILENDIDEIYCSISALNDQEIDEIIRFSDNNMKTLKFVPDTKNAIFRNFKYQYYGYISILSLRDIPLEEPIKKFIKRSFDIIFSSLIIIFLLSWLIPIVALFIKLESKGTIFFKQSRNGINNKEFSCFKFRSMMPNKEANLHQATKNDMRVTKVGRFIRKTSIDELPQFFNVFLGDMSVVGPRPHMVSHTNMYAKSIDKFMVRHLVKPGITGMAQVSGYRGEIETKNDIINRVKHDIFYIENWSLLLDLKIVFLTVYNAVKGEEKAY